MPGRMGIGDGRGHGHQTSGSYLTSAATALPELPSPSGSRDRWQRETPASMGDPGLKDERKISLERDLVKNLGR